MKDYSRTYRWIFKIEPSDIEGEKRFYDFREAAKVMNVKGVGRNKLLKFLREKGALNSYNEPTEEWFDSGFFKKANNLYGTTLISSHGINYIKRIYF